MSTHRPLLGMLFLYAAGIFFSRYIPVSFSWAACSAGFLILFSFVVRHKLFSKLLIFICIFLIGLTAGKNAQLVGSGHIVQLERLFRQKPVLVEGVIISQVQKRAFHKGKKTVFILEMKRFKVGLEDSEGKFNFDGKRWKVKQGKVLVNVFGDFPLQYGDRIHIQGKLHRPFNFSPASAFSYAEYLEQRGIKFILSVKKSARMEVVRNEGHPTRKYLLFWKVKVKSIFDKYLSPNAAGLITALILGDRYDIPKSLKELFIQTGTAHILAISGFNVGIMAFVFFLILKISRVPRFWQFLLTIFFLIFYCFFTGAQAPVVRATIMSIIFLSSFIIERETEALNSWALAALILLIANPLYLFDIGFQLSFLSVLFMIIFCPKVSQWFKNRFPQENRAAEYIVQSFTISLTAWLGVSGLIAYYFKIFTPITVLANFFIVPLSSLNIALGLGLILSGIFFPWMAVFFVQCIALSLNLMIWIAYSLAQVPGAYFYLEEFPLTKVILYYGILIFILYIVLKRIWILQRVIFLKRKVQGWVQLMKPKFGLIDKENEV